MVFHNHKRIGMIKLLRKVIVKVVEPNGFTACENVILKVWQYTHKNNET